MSESRVGLGLRFTLATALGLGLAACGGNTVGSGASETTSATSTPWNPIHHPLAAKVECGGFLPKTETDRLNGNREVEFVDHTGPGKKVGTIIARAELTTDTQGKATIDWTFPDGAAGVNVQPDHHTATVQQPDGGGLVAMHVNQTTADNLLGSC